MVVYEIKDPGGAGTYSRPSPLRPGLEPAIAVQGPQLVAPVVGGRRERDKGRESRGGRRMVPLDQASVREVVRLIAQINDQLEIQGTKIHLVLVADDEGFAIDLYDCSDTTVCRSIHDISIGPSDLPILLARLVRQAGIMVDTVL